MIILQQINLREMFIDGVVMISNGENTRYWKTNCKAMSPSHGAPITQAG